MANSSSATRTWHVEAEAAEDMSLTPAERAAADNKGQTAARVLHEELQMFLRAGWEHRSAGGWSCRLTVCADAGTEGFIRHTLRAIW